MSTAMHKQMTVKRKQRLFTASTRRHRDVTQQQRITTVPRTRHGIKRLKEQTTTETQSLGPFLYPLFNAQILPSITQYLSANTLVVLRSMNKYFKSRLCTRDVIRDAVLTISTTKEREGVDRMLLIVKNVVVNILSHGCVSELCYHAYYTSRYFNESMLQQLESLTMNISYGSIHEIIAGLPQIMFNPTSLRSLIINTNQTEHNNKNIQTLLVIPVHVMENMTSIDIHCNISSMSWLYTIRESTSKCKNVQRFRYHHYTEMKDQDPEKNRFCGLFALLSMMSNLKHLDLANINLTNLDLDTVQYIQMKTLDGLSHHLESLVLFDCKLRMADQKTFTQSIARIPVVGIDIHHYALLDHILLESLVLQAEATNSKRLHTMYIEGLPNCFPVPPHYRISFVSTTHKEFKDKDDIVGYDVPSTWKEIQDSAVFFNEDMLDATVRDFTFSDNAYLPVVKPGPLPADHADSLEEARKLGIAYIKELIKPNLYSEYILV
jgi:hypothetical protein